MCHFTFDSNTQKGGKGWQKYMIYSVDYVLSYKKMIVQYKNKLHVQVSN